MGEVLHRRVHFCPSQAAQGVLGWVWIPPVPINHSHKGQESQETPLWSQLVISSWPRRFLCLVDLTQAGSEAAAKKVFIRKYGSEGNI